jgi:8-oxo-dGTP diphosphatase
LVLPDEIFIDEPKHDFSELTINDAGFIYNSSDYKDFISIPYITERIKNGLNSCIRYMNEPIAWAITQDDGAIGFLHVLPEYRRRGYGRDVILDLIRKVRDKNKIPFAHIEEENKKSMGLAMGLGFKKYSKVSWFEII